MPVGGAISNCSIEHYITTLSSGTAPTISAIAYDATQSLTSSPNAFEVTWDVVDGAIGYRIEYWNINTPGTVYTIDLSDGWFTSGIIGSSLTFGETYGIRVGAIFAGNPNPIFSDVELKTACTNINVIVDNTSSSGIDVNYDTEDYHRRIVVRYNVPTGFTLISNSVFPPGNYLFNYSEFCSPAGWFLSMDIPNGCTEYLFTADIPPC